MKDAHYQIAGLVGFILAGIVFIAVGIKYGDPLTILGSVIWVISCLIWLVPLVKPQRD